MASSFKARVNKLKSTRVSVSQKSEKPSQQTPLSGSIEEETLKVWLNSTNSLNNAISRIESDVSSVKSDRDRVIKLEVELEKLMQLIANKDYFKNIFMEMLESMEQDEGGERGEGNEGGAEEEEEKWKLYIDSELNNLRSILNTTHNNIKEINQNNSKKIDFLEEKINNQELVSNLKQQYDEFKESVNSLKNELGSMDEKTQKDASEFRRGLTWTNSQLDALKQDYIDMVNNQKNFKNDIEVFETFKNKQKKINELIEENCDKIEKIKKENINIKNNVETIEKITKESSTIFVTKVSELADHIKKLDGRLGRCENYSKDLGMTISGVKELFDGEKVSLSKIISNLKDDFVDLHERCDNTLNIVYRNDTQHIIDKYVFELSQLNVLFESSKTMQRENNYLKCIGNLSMRIDKIEQKIN
jgi:chromosome segregation ATPase